jgi:hypothetical protein
MIRRTLEILWQLMLIWIVVATILIGITAILVAFG